MIAADTSSLRRFLEGKRGEDVDAVAGAIDGRALVLPPVVLTELLSDASVHRVLGDVLTELPQLPLLDGYWNRAGFLRAKVLAAGFKSKVSDALVAQSCLDHDVPLVTHDRDFRHYVPYGLVLI